MYSTLPDDRRNAHPYHMYDEIKLQPEVVARSIALAEERSAAACTAIGEALRVFVTGCGTSFFAAKGGASMFSSFSRGGIDARAFGAFELSHYGPRLGRDDVVIGVTHSGNTTMTLRALDLARAAGAATIAITGFEGGAAAERADFAVLTGYGEERSWAHTASYTAALATLAAMANTLAHRDERLDLSPLGDLLREVLRLEDVVHRIAGNLLVAEAHRGAIRIVVVGGGPNAATAEEGVLKLLETSYISAMAFELEMMLHGPLAAVDEDTLVLILAPGGPSLPRAAELSRAVQQLGVVPVVLTDGEGEPRFEDAHRLVLPELPEVLSPIPYVIPLQLLSYFLAMGKGGNPDLIHRDDERYRLARGEYE